MDMFLYLDKNTYMHRLDPRTKIFAMVSSFALVMMAPAGILLAGISLLVLAYGASGRTLANLNRIKYLLLMLAVVSTGLWSFMGQGSTVLWGPVTQEGLYYGIATGIRLDMMIIAGMIFLSSTKIEEIAIGIEKLGLPYRAAFAFSTALRLVPLIVATSYTIMQAQRSRGLDIDSGNILQRAKKYIPLLIPVFISVIRGTNVFAMALESKGFGYSSERTHYLQIGYKTIDFVLLTGVASLLGSVIFLTISGRY